MNDPTIPATSERKKFMFYDTEERQASLRIRCKYDGINQSFFFRAMLTGYIENDPLIIEFLDKFKEKNSIQGQKKREYVKKMRASGQDTKQKFALDDSEINSIFDLIESETNL